MRARPTPEQRETLRRLAEEAGAPPPPEAPVVGECCERHCDPCVWDYWRRALDRWAERHDLASALTTAFEAD